MKKNKGNFAFKKKRKAKALKIWGWLLKKKNNNNNKKYE